MRLPGSHAVALIALVLLNGCAIGSNARSAPAAVAEANGPAADYPVLIGDPYTVGDVTWTPTDKLNYDEVGTASVAEGMDSAITAAHKTLPVPSYIEVTSLDTGRTILVRVSERGPMRNDVLVQLSPGAAAQLGITSNTAVRVRRVNPPEAERSQLRFGGHAAERMATPKPLLAALRRKLDRSASDASMSPVQPAPVSRPMPVDPEVAAAFAPPAGAEPPRAVPVEPVLTRKGDLVVQVGAFSTRERAESVSRGVDGGFVVKPAKYWLVRTGPHPTAAAAEAALAKAKGAGYSDARIQRAE